MKKKAFRDDAPAAGPGATDGSEFEVIEVQVGGAGEPGTPPRKRRGLSGVASMVALVAVVLLAAAAIGVPLAMRTAGAHESPDASASAEDSTPSPEVTPEVTPEASIDPSVDQIDDPLAEQPSGVTASAVAGDPNWWKPIELTASKTVTANTQDGWVELRNAPATSLCSIVVYESAKLQDALGGFGDPSVSPHRREFGVAETTTGTVYVRVNCWRDGLAGPKHGWSLPVTVIPAAPWAIDLTNDATVQAGDTLHVGVQTPVSASCTLKVTWPSGVSKTLYSDSASDGVRTTKFDVPSDMKSGTAKISASCDDGMVKHSATSSAEVSAVAPPPPPPPDPTPEPTPEPPAG